MKSRQYFKITRVVDVEVVLFVVVIVSESHIFRESGSKGVIKSQSSKVSQVTLQTT